MWYERYVLKEETDDVLPSFLAASLDSRQSQSVASHANLEIRGFLNDIASMLRTLVEGSLSGNMLRFLTKIK